jgi:hypothetical protein
MYLRAELAAKRSSNNGSENFSVFTAVAMKNAVFWYITSRGFRKNQRFGGTFRLHHQG